MQWDHPRIRGEHPENAVYRTDLHGSSPHTRGARVKVGALCVAGGIIPAYAGSTYITPPTSSTSPDHPRIRGEHFTTQVGVDLLEGSSPHTRGAQVLGDNLRVHLGIIPAYAGSTCRPRPRWRRRWDHPRIRGEHGLCNLGPEATPGSSPHTRGAPEAIEARSPS